jgi:GalNAc-alpha-(1->4)-GalNAc-alpha-(1->3)-diNAcBac-PP-undecaprenol alpha-1,4-N-acetyl-D-galactosaminyltransferase
MAKMILVIPTLKQGGAERVMSELANEWANNGNKVLLVLLVKSNIFYKLDSKVELVNLGLDINNTNRISKAINSFRIFLTLRKFIRRNNPDFVLSFIEKYNIFTLFSAAFLNVNTFVSDRNNPKIIISKKMELLKKLFYNNAKGIIAQTSLSKEILCTKTNHDNIRVIPNPVRYIDNTLKIKKEKIILNVGRLVPEKGQHYLIEMMSHLKNDEWKLIILGDGPLREKLQIQIDKLDLNNKVILMGSVSNVDEWYIKSSIFAFSSVSEGFPNALVEAMVSGLPSVSFDCDAGPRDILANNINGFLIPLYDVDMFKNVLQKLMDNVDLRNEIGLEAFKVSERLNIRKVAQEYLDFCLK